MASFALADGGVAHDWSAAADACWAGTGAAVVAVAAECERAAEALVAALRVGRVRAAWLAGGLARALDVPGGGREPSRVLLTERSAMA